MFMNIQLFAHHKGGGSTKNGRDSNAKRLGIKAADGQTDELTLPLLQPTKRHSYE